MIIIFSSFNPDIRIVFKDYKITALKRSATFTFANFLANCGGKGFQLYIIDISFRILFLLTVFRYKFSFINASIKLEIRRFVGPIFGRFFSEHHRTHLFYYSTHVSVDLEMDVKKRCSANQTITFCTYCHDCSNPRVLSVVFRWIFLSNSRKNYLIFTTFFRQFWIDVFLTLFYSYANQEL